MSRRSLEGARALVTGASSGIGRHLALELARAGCDLVLLARREERLASLAAAIEGIGRRAEVVAGDVTEAAIRTAAFERARAVFGGLDLLVNNAGVSAHGPFADAAPERLRQIMEVNFFAAAELTRESLPLLLEGREPIVVNVASILAHRGIPHNSEYCASKFALRGWSESLRAELAGKGVDVLVVSPGSTETELFDHLLEKQVDLPWENARGAAPDAVARAAVKAIRAGRHEIVPSWRGRFLVWLNRAAPWLVDRIMARYG